MDTIDTNEVRFTMRMENDLYERIKETAKKNKRSIAKEIEYHLEQSLEKDTVHMLEKIYDFVDDFGLDYKPYFDKVEEILEIVKK